MTKSSIHFERADLNFAEKHNARESEPSYLLEKQDRKKNDFVKLADIHELYSEQMKIRASNHSRGRAPALKDVYWEAVINLDERHTLEDVQKVAEFLQKNYSLTATSVAIHRDEGYKDKETHEVKYNYHAHVTFFTMSDGKSVMRTMTRSKLSRMQTDVAELLHLERGRENSDAERLSAKQYRSVQRELEQVKEQEQAKYLTLAEQKRQIEAERKLYKTQNSHIAEDYRKLQALNKTLHTQEELNKALELLRSEYEQRIQTLEKEHEKQIEAIYEVPQKIFTAEDLKKRSIFAFESKDDIAERLNQKIAPIAKKAALYEHEKQLKEDAQQLWQKERQRRLEEERINTVFLSQLTEQELKNLKALNAARRKEKLEKNNERKKLQKVKTRDLER